jgi:hypothetical protein
MRGLLIVLSLLCLLLAISHAKLYQVVAMLAPGVRYHLNDYYDGG